MRTKKEIEGQLRTLTQAYYFSSVHRGELSEDARVKHRAMEESIRLLRWCLEQPDAAECTWQAVRQTFAEAFRLLRQVLFGRFGGRGIQLSQDAVHPPVSTHHEVPG